MLFVLDTSVAIPLRDGDSDVIAKTEKLSGPFALSIITRVELEGGTYTERGRTAARRLRLDNLLAIVPTLPFDDEAAEIYGKIVESAGYSRRKVIDRMIAAQAIAQRATLVTLNPGDFSDVPRLKLLAL